METNVKSTDKNEIDLRELLETALRYWYLFVVSIVIFLALGAWYLVRKTPKVTTHASIMLRQHEGGMGFEQLDQLSMLGVGGNTTAEDELVVLNSKDLMLQAIDKLNLYQDHYIKLEYRWEGEYPEHTFELKPIRLIGKAKRSPFTLTIKPLSHGYRVKYVMGYEARGSVKVANFDSPLHLPIGDIQLTPLRPLEPGAQYRITYRTVSNAIAYYRGLTKINQHKRESNIFDFAITSTIPHRDADLLNALIAGYNSNVLTDKNMIASNTAEFIDERLKIISKELTSAEDAVEQYKTENNMANLGEEAKLLLEAGVEDQKQLAEIESQLSLINYIADCIGNEKSQYDLLPATVTIEDQGLSTFIAEYNAALLRYMRMQRTAVAGSPVLDQIETELQTMRSNIETSIANVREGLLISKAGLDMRQAELSERIKRVPKQEREYIQLARQRQLKESLYMLLFKKREENALTLAATATPTKMVDTPRTDPESSSPKPIRIILLCLILGFMAPVMLLYLFKLLDNKVRDVKTFQKRLNVPYLGEIIVNSRGKHIAINDGEMTVSAELFRLLRTNLRFMLPAECSNPVILVSSCINGEGKSYISANLAMSLAILGKKVALVGLDIRKPTLAKNFELQQQGCLTSYLAEESYTVDDTIVPSGKHQNLDILPCGVIPPNPNELLQSERLDQLFAELRERYDYIIVDTAPCAMVSDTYLLDRVADMTLFVSRVNYTHLDAVDFINQLSEQKRFKQIASVLNATRSSRAGYGYGYDPKSKKSL